jgi:hypothetical protein
MNFWLKRDAAVLSSSWMDLRLLATTDERWTTFIQDVLADPAAFPDSIFDRAVVQSMWNRFRSGDFTLGFSIDSLLVFGLIHKYYGNGNITESML